jgi:hypothetical protein
VLVKRTLIVLVLPRSFGTVTCAMLGQHPQLFSLLESRLFSSETLRQWWETTERHHLRPDGLLRDIAEVIFGRQTERTIEQACRWLWRRRGWSTVDVFRKVATCLEPLGLVEKTPIVGTRDDKIQEQLRRRLQAFPHAHFLHLVRHPRGQGQSRIEQLKTETRIDNPAKTAITYKSLLDEDSDPPVIDPQVMWHRVNRNILEFLATLPPDRHKRLRGEDLLADPDHHLRELCGWLGVRFDAVAIEEMKHPERSPFACWGPPNARDGGDGKFFANPALRVGPPKEQRLDGPLPWRDDRAGFKVPVRELAARFGYL